VSEKLIDLLTVEKEAVVQLFFSFSCSIVFVNTIGSKIGAIALFPEFFLLFFSRR